MTQNANGVVTNRRENMHYHLSYVGLVDEKIHSVTRILNAFYSKSSSEGPSHNLSDKNTIYG